MAFAPVSPRAHTERRVARMYKERRSPQAGVSSPAESATFTPTVTVGSVQASSTSAHQAVNTNLPTSVKALVGFIVVLGVFILGTQSRSDSVRPLTDQSCAHRYRILEDKSMENPQEKRRSFQLAAFNEREELV